MNALVQLPAGEANAEIAMTERINPGISVSRQEYQDAGSQSRVEKPDAGMR